MTMLEQQPNWIDFFSHLILQEDGIGLLHHILNFDDGTEMGHNLEEKPVLSAACVT